MPSVAAAMKKLLPCNYFCPRSQRCYFNPLFELPLTPSSAANNRIDDSTVALLHPHGRRHYTADALPTGLVQANPPSTFRNNVPDHLLSQIFNVSIRSQHASPTHGGFT